MRRRLAGISALRKGRRAGRAVARHVVAAIAAIVLAAAAPPEETIGSWRLACPEASNLGCVLRHKDASLQSGGYAAALEVQSVDGGLVPVVAVRGMPSRPAIAALLQVTIGLRLDQGPWVALPCGPALRCLPAADALPALAQALPAAGTLRLRLEVTLPNGTTLPRPEHAFTLSRTKQALERLRQAGAANAVAPVAPGLDWEALLRKLLRAGG